MSANASGFVPVKFCSTNCPVLQSYPSYAFAFPPAPATVDALQTPDFSDSGADRNSLRVRDAIEYFEVHNINLFTTRQFVSLIRE